MSESIPIVQSAPVPPPEAPAQAKRAGHGLTIARNSLWLLVDNTAAMASSFYCSVVASRALGPDRMGDYNYVLWFATVLRLITEVALPATVRKFAAELTGREDYGTLRTLVRVALRLQLKLALVGVPCGIVAVRLLAGKEQVAFATVAVLSVIPALLMSIPSGALWATENLRYNVLGSLGGIAVNVVGVTLSVVLKWGLMGLVVSFLASRVVDCILRFLLFRWVYAKLPGEASGSLDPTLRKRMSRFAARQMALVGFQMLLFDRMEVFFLKGMAASREIAFFSLPFTLVQYTFVLPGVLAQSAGATLFVQQGRDPREVARMAAAMTWFMVLVAAPTYFGLAALSDPLMRLIYDARYLPAIPVLTVLALFGVCRALMGPTEQLLIVTEQQVFFIICAGAAAVISVVGNTLLIPPFGAVGAAFAKGISQAAMAIAFVAFMVLRFKVTLPWARMVKLMIVCTVMFLAVRAAGRPFRPLAALLIGVPLGAAIFVVLTRLLRCLDSADRDRLRQLDRMVPARVRHWYVALVGFLVPV